MLIRTDVIPSNRGRPMKRSAEGFTLIELLIVVAIVGVLVAAAIASYGFAIVKTNRAAGKGCLLEQAQLAEKFYTTNLTYVGTPVHQCWADPSSTYALGPPAPTLTARTFLFTAVPFGAQATRDTLCASLTVNQVGAKGFTGTGSSAECW